MKFSHQLQLNLVSEWSAHYVAYSQLKKIIYHLEKETASQAYQRVPGVDLEIGRVGPDARSLGYQDHPARRNYDVFSTSLKSEQEKVVEFFIRKERELRSRMDQLVADAVRYRVNSCDRSGRTASRSRALSCLTSTVQEQNVFGAEGIGFYPEPIQDGEERPLLHDINGESSVTTGRGACPGSQSQQRQPSIGSLRSSPTCPRAGTRAASLLTSSTADVKGHKLRRDVAFLYIDINELITYIDLNRAAFSKILKKYDKIMGVSIRESFMAEHINVAYPFLPSTKDSLDHLRETCENLYWDVSSSSTREEAVDELRDQLRDFISFEKNTIWRDLIQRERKVAALGPIRRRTRPTASGQEKTWSMSLCRTSFEQNQRWLYLILGLVSFITVLNTRLLDDPSQRNCLAILVFVSILWATGALPLFTTSLLVPLLIVVLRVAKDPDTGKRLDGQEQAHFAVSAMFSPVILLLLGGFTLAAALSKHGIAKTAAQMVLNRVSNRTEVVILANMLVALVASMWISNVAAPVLCFSLIQPVLRTLPSGAFRLGQAMIIGIAMASNIGGMASPISSPQNIIAIANMDPQPGWLQWFFIALPAAFASTFAVWLLVLWIYKPSQCMPRLYFVHRSGDRFSLKEYSVLCVTASTVALWCVQPTMPNVLGDMGIVALVPIVLFFGGGLLSKDDFNNFLWTVVALAQGGMALGKAVENSGLLATVAMAIASAMSGHGLWAVLIAFSLLMMTLATFVSHTVASLIILPIVREVGNQLPEPHPRLLVMASALMASGAMSLPASGFPNMNAISQEDPEGKPYLKSKDLLKVGVPGTIAVWAYLVTLGFLQMRLIGF